MTAAPGPRSLAARVARAAGVLGVFAILGPALGGVLVFCCVYPVILLFGLDMANMPSDQAATSEHSALNMIGPLFLFVAMAYAFGGVQAALTGLYAAFAEWRDGLLSNRETVVAAIVATLIWIAIIYSPLNPLDANDASGSTKLRQATQIAVALIPIGIVCALFCRWLSRKFGLLSGH